MKPDVHYVRNGDVSLAYQVIGEGPADLFVAIGYLSNLVYAWEIPSQAAFFRRLAASRRLILMDRRGSGLSDRFSPSDAPPQETLVEDVRVVLDAAGSARTALLGLWDGCMTGTLFAATYPERVTSLILFSAYPAGSAVTEDLPGGWDEEQWEEWLASIRLGWGTRAWTVQNLRWQSPSILEDPDLLEQFIAFSRLSASPSSAEAVLRIEKDTDIRHILPAVRVPTLVLTRTGDQAQPIDGGRYIAAKIPEARFVELPGNDAVPWVGDARSVLREIDQYLDQSSGRASGPERRLGTVLFTDIVGSTEHLVGMGDGAWRERLAEHDRIAKEMIERSGGDYINTTGDGFLATFSGPAAAVRCALAVGDAVRSLGLEIRAGVHTGELEIAENDIRGMAVHIGARVMSLAQPSEVLVSSTVRDLTAGSGIVFEDRGEHELKGIPDRWHLYRVVSGSP